MAQYHGRRFGGAGLVRGTVGLSTEPRHTTRRGVFPYVPSEEEIEKRQELVAKIKDKTYSRPARSPEKPSQNIILGNPDLPSFAKKNEINQTILNNQVTIVVGPTGSGKSTQVPQFLLESGFDTVVLTQPRIMASNGVGHRISDELAQSFNDDSARQLVAVQTSEKFEHQEGARIFVRTDGLEQVLQLEQYLSGLTEQSANEQAAKTVVVVDEAHESNINQVGILAITHRLLNKYPDMRVVVMSATLDASKYVDYFSDDCERCIPVVEIEGRPADVEWMKRPDQYAIEMVAKLVNTKSALEPGDDILLFTSGKNEIKRLIKAGKQACGQIEFVGLDASMLEDDQERAVSAHPDTIRVIVSTDVAMTSLTLPNVKYVIDEAIVKNPVLDEEGKEGLVTQYCSQSEILQRGGRAGRVRSGFHIQVRPHEETGMNYVGPESRQEFPDPPIYSTDLSNMVLKFASYGVDLEELKLIDPVSIIAIKRAKDKLYNLGAIDENDLVTDLGKFMNQFPLDVEYSRMIAEAHQKKVPKDVMISTIMAAAAFSVGGLRDFMQQSKEGNEPWRELIGSPGDDAMLEVRLLGSAGLVCTTGDTSNLRRYHLAVKNVQKARKVFRRCAGIVGVDPQGAVYRELDGDGQSMFRHCVTSGFMDQIFVRQGRTRSGEATYQNIPAGGVPRTISSRSVVDTGQARMIVGDPRYFMHLKGGEWHKRDIIEYVIPVTEEELQKLGLRETTVVDPTELTVTGGMIKATQQRKMGGLLRGKEQVAISSDEVDHGTVLQLILNNPGPAQRALRQLKADLEQLQHMTLRPVKQITQQDYEAILMRAIRQSNSMELHLIDLKIAELTQQGIYRREYYISAETEKNIREQAVPSVNCAGVAIGLTYQNGHPIAKGLGHDAILSLPDSVTIPDGREVLFRVPKVAPDGSVSTRGHRDLTAENAKQDLERAYPDLA